ncbi:hypothetical protein GR927_00890 [Mycolicibacterium sp. 3033]|nr:hypothetical protein [Mycolicibacterium aurantiacum]
MSLVLATSVVGAAAVLAWRWRGRTIPLCVLAVATVPALFLVVVITGEVAADLALRAATITVATVVLSVLTALLWTKGLPQLVSRSDRSGVAVVCAALSAMYVAVAVFLLVAADDTASVADAEVLVDRDQFVASRDAPARQAGVLLQGTLRGPTGSPVVATHGCVTVGTHRLLLPGGRFPDRYLVDFPGGPPVVVAGISSGSQAWGWPAGGTDNCVLRTGDRVVVWGHLRGGMGGGATSYTGLADVRIVAAGDADTFLDRFRPAAERTGRMVVVLAGVNGALAVAVAVAGVHTCRRLTRTGNDDPPRITWRSGPR